MSVSSPRRETALCSLEASRAQRLLCALRPRASGLCATVWWWDLPCQQQGRQRSKEVRFSPTKMHRPPDCAAVPARAEIGAAPSVRQRSSHWKEDLATSRHSRRCPSSRARSCFLLRISTYEPEGRHHQGHPGRTGLWSQKLETALRSWKTSIKAQIDDEISTIEGKLKRNPSYMQRALKDDEKQSFKVDDRMAPKEFLDRLNLLHHPLF